MKFYKPRAVIVRAIQVKMETLDELVKHLEFTTWSNPPMRAVTGIQFKQGEVLPTIVPFGAWIIFPTSGSPYPLSDDEFIETYQPLTQD